MSLQRLARIQGHGIRVLDEAYSEQLAKFEERAARIDPVEEIEAARRLVARADACGAGRAATYHSQRDGRGAEHAVGLADRASPQA